MMESEARRKVNIMTRNIVRDSRAELKFSISSVMLLQEALVLSTVGRALTMMTCRMLSLKTDNILVPVLLVATTRIGLNFKLGVQPEFMVHSNADYFLNKVNLSIPVGLSYEWKHIALDVRYNIGVTSIYKDSNSYDKTSHGSTFLVTLGYGFDL